MAGKAQTLGAPAGRSGDVRTATDQAARFLRVTALVMLAVAALVPVVTGEFYTRLAIEALLFGAIALSVDILLGFAGMLSLGQAAYFGLAAYATALLSIHVTQSFWLILIVVMPSVAILAAVFGTIAIRARGVYFALITFGAAEVLGKVANNTDFLGGSDGLIGISVPAIALPVVPDIPLTDSVWFFYAALVMIVVTYALVRRLLDTPVGSVLRGLRDNNSRVPYLGYNPFWYRLFAYVLAAQVAALGGLLYPILRGFVAPNLFGFEVSTKAVIMALVGGIGTLIGPLFGGGVITFLESVISGFTHRHLIVLGVIFVLFVLYVPDGLVGVMLKRLRARAGVGS